MNPFRKTLCACTIFVAAVSATLPVSFAHETKPGTIAVTGTGEATVTPDMAMVTLVVLREAPTAREALDANNEAMAAVLAAMRAEGIESRDLQTSNFNIQPRYTYPQPDKNTLPGAPRIDGYVVNNALTIRLRNLPKLGAVLDKAVTLGVNAGGNITFTTENPEEAIETARTNAVKNALSKARTIVTTANVNLGPIVEITEVDRQPPRPMAMRNMAADSGAEAVPVAAGENTYTITVNVRWEIDQ